MVLARNATPTLLESMKRSDSGRSQAQIMTAGKAFIFIVREKVGGPEVASFDRRANTQTAVKVKTNKTQNLLELDSRITTFT